MARNIVSNISCNFVTKIGNGRVNNINVLFRGNYLQGYITFDLYGNDTLEGVVYKLKSEDIKKIQKYIDIQYKCDIINLEVELKGVKQKILTFAPQEKMRLNIPDSRYLEKLETSYSEFGINKDNLYRYLAKTFIKLYPEMKNKYMLIKKGESKDV
jgi:hypothetical protein